MILAMNERLFGVITMFLIVANHSIIAAVRIRACQNFGIQSPALTYHGRYVNEESRYP